MTVPVAVPTEVETVAVKTTAPPVVVEVGATTSVVVVLFVATSKLKIGEVEMTFLHTPGHTEGAQCVLVEDKLVTGDTLFVGACGRCDLSGGDEKKLMQSLKRLASLDGSLEIFPGHAYGNADSSTIGNERRTNPFMKFS